MPNQSPAEIYVRVEKYNQTNLKKIMWNWKFKKCVNSQEATFNNLIYNLVSMFASASAKVRAVARTNAEKRDKKCSNNALTAYFFFRFLSNSQNDCVVA